MSHYFIEDKNIKTNKKLNNVIVNDISFSFYTDNGLFNKNGLDFGTRLLMENFDYSNKNTFLDLGCGCGPVGIYLSLLNSKNKVDMTDINKSCVDISLLSIKTNNIKNANVFLSDGFTNITSKYDAILFNPPIHAGKKIIYSIIEEAKDHLNENGELWIVMRKDHGALTLIKDMSNIFTFEIVKKSKGFLIIKFKKQ